MLGIGMPGIASIGRAIPGIGMLGRAGNAGNGMLGIGMPGIAIIGKAIPGIGMLGRAGRAGKGIEGKGMPGIAIIGNRNEHLDIHPSLYNVVFPTEDIRAGFGATVGIPVGVTVHVISPETTGAPSAHVGAIVVPAGIVTTDGRC